MTETIISIFSIAIICMAWDYEYNRPESKTRKLAEKYLSKIEG